LRSFQITELVYDGTRNFCDLFVEKRSRTHDQMVQAARSGRQNIAEGSVASATSKTTELRLTNVAKASLEELLLDYEDYLRQRGLHQWAKDSPDALAVRERYRQGSWDRSDVYGNMAASAEFVANTMICLINQATYLLRRQIQRLEQDFLRDGGIRERLYHARVQTRVAQSQPVSPSEESHAAPVCPRCGRGMVERVARKGRYAGERFWGCADYPRCTGTRPFKEHDELVE
jgi:four helix bundle suffix protein